VETKADLLVHPLLPTLAHFLWIPDRQGREDMPRLFYLVAVS
jgi:hypothetical protein